MLLGPYTGGALVTLVGRVHPCYRTFKSLSDKDEHQSAWLTFWIIFSVFSAIEFLFDLVLWWCPLYYELKVGFVLALQPTFGNVAALIYKRAEPKLVSVAPYIDAKYQEIVTKCKNFRPEDLTSIAENAPAAVQGLLRKAVAAGGKAPEVKKKE
jgi:hypothetical protein